MNQQSGRSILARVLFALFLAIVACGMSFYVILFASLTIAALTHGRNPATTPELQAGLRFIVLPLSVLIGAAVFFLSLRGWGKRRVGELPGNSGFKKPAA